MVQNIQTMIEAGMDPAISNMARQAGSGVTNAIYNASEKTGADFAYLMEKASAESSFRPNAQAKTSSARGLFQFIDSTWLRMINNYGSQHGLQNYADMIDENGKVEDPSQKSEILALRDDPETAALMAAEFASENKRILESRLGLSGQDIGASELYLAHFLGAGGASKFLENKADNPDQEAASILPAAAKANQAVFYHENGEPRSVNEVYEYFAGKFETSGKQADQTQVNISGANISGANIKGIDHPLNSQRAEDLQSLVKETPHSRRNPNAFQEAFLAHQSSYDKAVRELLLSPIARTGSGQIGFAQEISGSGSFMQLLDLTFFLNQSLKDTY